MKSRKGFTLIELMVVILIVAILAAVMIPILRGRIDAAKWAEGKSMMGSIATSIRAWAAEKGPDYTGAMPASLAELGFSAGDFDGTYFGDADFAGCFSGIVIGPPTQFTITVTPSARSTAPTTPASYTLSCDASGISTWSP